jgi:hypothetical protein
MTLQLSGGLLVASALHFRWYDLVSHAGGYFLGNVPNLASAGDVVSAASSVLAVGHAVSHTSGTVVVCRSTHAAFVAVLAASQVAQHEVGHGAQQQRHHHHHHHHRHV